MPGDDAIDDAFLASESGIAISPNVGAIDRKPPVSSPSGLRDFCSRRGISPWHPESWGPHDRDAYHLWKVAWFRSKWAAFKIDGMTSLMPRAHLLSRIREDLDRVNEPVPSRFWVGACPCHQRPRQRAEDRSEHPKGVTAALAYISSFRPTPTPAERRIGR
jgi:hypothetical protein